MQPLVSVINVFEDNFEYWAERDLQGIPPIFRKRIGELGKCKLIRPALDRMFEVDPEIIENLFKSKFVFECVSYFHPPLISLFQELAKKGVEFTILTSESVFQRYSENCSENLKSMLAVENIKIFLYSGELRIPNLTVTDKIFLISLFSKNQKYFDRENLISYESSAIKFGTELFNELLRNSTQVTQIP
jgi:predicted transcriptional regulator